MNKIRVTRSHGTHGLQNKTLREVTFHNSQKSQVKLPMIILNVNHMLWHAQSMKEKKEIEAYSGNQLTLASVAHAPQQISKKS